LGIGQPTNSLGECWGRGRSKAGRKKANQRPRRSCALLRAVASLPPPAASAFRDPRRFTATGARHGLAGAFVWPGRANARVGCFGEVKRARARSRRAFWKCGVAEPSGCAGGAFWSRAGGRRGRVGRRGRARGRQDVNMRMYSVMQDVVSISNKPIRAPKAKKRKT
jgi:hypothetical protein